MSTLCLSDMGELRDEWLREPRPPLANAVTAREPEPPAPAARSQPALLPDDAAVAA